MKFPEKVYKYRIWRNEYHKNLLLKNELYLASPKDINDPFDCRIPPNYTRMNNDEKKQYIDDMVIGHFYDLENKGRNIESVMKNLEKRMENSINFQEEAEKILYDKQNKHYGILSLSKRWNGILLWSHYSNCHTGFCIGFWTQRLWETRMFEKAGTVTYKKKFPEIKPIVSTKSIKPEKAFIQTHTKSEDWTYEEEYRFLKIFFPKVPKSEERIAKISDEIISEVVLGINISNEDKSEIVNICFKKNIPVYQARKKEFMFEIERELIK